MNSSPEEVRSRSSSRRNSSRRSSLKKTPSFEDSPRRSSLKKEETSSRRSSLKKEEDISKKSSLKKEDDTPKRSLKEDVKRGLKKDEEHKKGYVKENESPKGSVKEGFPKKSNLKKEDDIGLKEDERPQSAMSTPKRTLKPSGTLDFVVTGKQITKRCDRANSLPGGYHRRPSDARPRKVIDKRTTTPQSCKSQETSLEEDMSLDLSQVSDFEDTNSKYGFKPAPLATSTPKPRPGPKPRSASLQSNIGNIYKMDTRRGQKSLDGVKSRDSTFSCSRDSFKTTSSSASPYRYGTELDYSSVSPEYSGQSSVDISPRVPMDLVVSPRGHNISSCCVSSWQDYSEAEATKVEDYRRADGEWNEFWVNYNNSLSKVPMKSYYDQCPTPYRTETIDLNDFDFSIHEGTRQRSPDNIKNINNIIRNEGLQLTPRETQNIIKCAHILGNVLSKAIERRTRENEVAKVEEIETGKKAEVNIKKKNLTLDLKETAIPDPVKEEKKSETVTTQTDISLPNTKSAPIIFERILKQLSKSSIDEADEDDDVFDVKDKK